MPADAEPKAAGTDKAKLGITGLDDVLGGGFTRNRLYLLEGSPGTGKTTVAMQFLLTGAAAGERGLYVSLSETKEEFRRPLGRTGGTCPTPSPSTS